MLLNEIQVDFLQVEVANMFIHCSVYSGYCNITTL